MSAIVNGNNAPIPTQTRFTKRRVGDSEWEISYVGLSDSVKAIEKSLWEQGASEVYFEPSEGNAIGRITARFSYDPSVGSSDAAESTLEIAFNDVSFPIHQNPNFIGITSARIKYLDLEAEKSSPSTPTDPTELAYFQLKQRGIEDYRVKVPVVTLTRTVSRKYPTALTVSDTGKIFTTSQVAGNVGSPILFSIPTGNVGISAASGWAAGWMQDTRVSATSTGSIQLIESYEFGLWSTALYTSA